MFVVSVHIRALMRLTFGLALTISSIFESFSMLGRTIMAPRLNFP